MKGCVPWPDEFAQRYRALGYWRGDTLGGMLRLCAQRWPDRKAVVCGQRHWCYAELDGRVDRLVAGLLRLGISAGDKVVVQLPNVAEFFVVCFALFRMGALPVFAQPAHRRSEIVHFCAISEAVAYVVADVDSGFDFRVLAREVQAQCVGLRHVVVVGQAQEFVDFDALYCTPSERSNVDGPKGGDWAFLQLSGGSTGLPKLIARTHDDYLYSVRASAPICGLGVDSVYLCALPVAHNFPLSSPGSLGTLYEGGCVVLARTAAPEVVFPLIEQHRVTMTALVPPLVKVWLDSLGSRPHDVSSLQVLQVGGARLSDEVARRVRPVLGCCLQQVFGMAEGLVNYTRLDDSDELVCGTQGTPISPHDEIRVVDDADQDVPEGCSGHLLTRGPYTIRGYFCAEEHNARAFTADGFYRTGDVVRRLPSGHLVVEGRAKDQINRGGEKVAAEEVENHLLAHPTVRDVALVSMPDAYLGERSCAVVIARGDRPRASELTRFLRDRGLAHYKIPDRIEFTEHFPHTAVGKVDKRALREHVAQLLNTSTTGHTP